MQYRHEWKHRISEADRLILRNRLKGIMQVDPYALSQPEQQYQVRSLYFDTPEDKALLEKLNGTDRREKFRIRCYNRDFQVIHLEKKCKIHGLCLKTKAVLTPRETEALLLGKREWMPQHPSQLVQELYAKMKYQRLRPKTLVEYTREPFVYGPGNVRVTMDHHLRTGLRSIDLLETEPVMIPAGDAAVILEVKWDAFLPTVIRDAIQLSARHSAPFSKYAACRIYG